MSACEDAVFKFNNLRKFKSWSSEKLNNIVFCQRLKKLFYDGFDYFLTRRNYFHHSCFVTEMIYHKNQTAEFWGTA